MSTVTAVKGPYPESTTHAPHYFGMTSVQIQRRALQAIAGVGALVGTVGAVRGGSERVVTIPMTVISVGGILYLSSTLKDYEDPNELRAMQEMAERLSFPEIIEKHGLQNATQYLLSVDARQEKFEEAYALSSLSDVLKSYPFETIGKYELATSETLRRCLLNELGKISVCDLQQPFVQTCKQQNLLTQDESDSLIAFIHQANIYRERYLVDCAVIDKKYPERKSKLLEELDMQAKKLPDEAKAMKKMILENGYQTSREQAEARFVVDAFFTPKSAMECFGAYVDNSVQGRTVTQEAAAKTAQSWLTQKLTEINSNRKYILEKNIGGEQENSYQKELNVLKSNYKDILENLQKRFSSRVATLSRFFRPLV